MYIHIYTYYCFVHWLPDRGDVQDPARQDPRSACDRSSRNEMQHVAACAHLKHKTTTFVGFVALLRKPRLSQEASRTLQGKIEQLIMINNCKLLLLLLLIIIIIRIHIVTKTIVIVMIIITLTTAEETSRTLQGKIEELERKIGKADEETLNDYIVLLVFVLLLSLSLSLSLLLVVLFRVGILISIAFDRE